MIENHTVYMSRCLELARKGLGRVSPNPMVGAVVVYQGTIIGEGYHRQWGGPHAEVNAIASVQEEDLLQQSTIYVTLEPCSHYGKTPPCAQLIIDKKIPRVVIGVVDPFEAVSGRGIRMLEDAGVEVVVGVMEQECAALNKTFFKAQIHQRPYVYLKWAQSADGFLDLSRQWGDGKKPARLSSPISSIAVHKLRAEVDAILVGYNTALLDNPKLNLRQWAGNDPLRVVIDLKGCLPIDLSLFDGSIPTLIISENTQHPAVSDHVFCEAVSLDYSIESQVLDILYKRGVQSLLVEGGAATLQGFIDQNLWDEARIEHAPVGLDAGVEAPRLSGGSQTFELLDDSIIVQVKNRL